MGKYWQQRSDVENIFNDLEKYKYFCANAWVLGFKESYRFNERDLYNEKSYVWRQYQKWLSGSANNYRKKRNKRKFN